MTDQTPVSETLPADEESLANFMYSIRSYDEAEAKAKLLFPLLSHAQTQQQPVAWRWRPRGATLWIYNPEIVWLDDNRDKIEAEPLYTAVSDTSTVGNSK